MWLRNYAKDGNAGWTQTRDTSGQREDARPVAVRADDTIVTTGGVVFSLQKGIDVWVRAHSNAGQATWSAGSHEPGMR